MKIIKRPNLVATCESCGCEFLFDKEDVYIATGGTRKGTPINSHKAVRCPFCDKSIKVFENINRKQCEIATHREIKVKTKGGYLWATESGDIDYPGIDIEFIADNDNGENLSRPRILVEYPSDGKLRALIWDDKYNEDYTREIEFDI